MTRLTDLRPRWIRVYRDRHLTPDNGGFPTDLYDLSFDCPDCGHPYLITIRIGPKRDDKNLIFGASPLPDGPDWPERVTIDPSIWSQGHGIRRPNCNFHKTVVKGKLLA